MRVLVLAMWGPWPPNHGGRLHLYHVLDQLSRRAKVTLALPVAVEHGDDLHGRIDVVTIPPPATNEHSRQHDRHGMSLVGRLARRSFGYKEGIDAWLHHNAHSGRFDVALLHGPALGQYARACRLPVVWDIVDELVLQTIRDAQYGSWRRWPAALRLAAFQAVYQRYVAQHTAASVFVSTVDAACARRWTGQAVIEVVQNGVDFDYFQPNGEPPTPGTVAFVGSLEFPPNIDAIVHFARRVWPRIHARGTQRRLLVVGHRPVAAVKALTALPGIELAADVPDVRPYLTRAAVVVVPMRKGGGLKNKVLEACAMNRPVVASPRALGGLNTRNGVDVLAADRPPKWVAQVCRLLEQPAYAQTIARNGFHWVRRAHRWTAAGDRYFEILSAACQRTPGTAPPPPGPEHHQLRATSHEPRATSYELRATSYELRATSYELQATSNELLP